jgi:hypothetical protein
MAAASIGINRRLQPHVCGLKYVSPLFLCTMKKEDEYITPKHPFNGQFFLSYLSNGMAVCSRQVVDPQDPPK